MRKAHFYYENNQNKRDNVPNWKAKRGNNFEQKINFKFNQYFGNKFRNYPRNNYQGTNFKGNAQQNYTTTKNKDIPNTYNIDIVQREPLKCWECVEPHYLKECPHKKKSYNSVHTVQEEVIVGDMARGIHAISATLDNRQDDYQISMVEIEGMIKRKPNSILIDPGARLSYVSPRIVESCKLKLDKFEKSWLVQLVTGAKRKVFSYVKDHGMIMNDFKTQVSLNVLLLGSYDILISMDWL